MVKREAEQSNDLSIFWLKKQGYLKGGQQYGGIKWIYKINKNENSVGFTVTTDRDEKNYIGLQYTYTNILTNEKQNINYRIELTTTPCNYGGKRYWFICPLTKDGKNCRRRVGVLFNTGKYFGCRHCNRIAYNSQMSGGRFRINSISIKDVERAEKEVKRYYYNGKPTRKYKRLIILEKKLEDNFIIFRTRFGDNIFNLFANHKK